MVAMVVSLTSASSTVHYFRREGHGLGKPVTPGSGPGQAEAEDYYARRDDEHRKASRIQSMCNGPVPGPLHLSKTN